jgi:hypothetical protein
VSHPRSELSSLAKGWPVADRSYHRGCDQRSDARDLAQPDAGKIARNDPLDFIDLCGSAVSPRTILKSGSKHVAAALLLAKKPLNLLFQNRFALRQAHL